MAEGEAGLSEKMGIQRLVQVENDVAQQFSHAEIREVAAAMEMAAALTALRSVQRAWPTHREVVRGIARSRGMTAAQIESIERVFEGAVLKLAKAEVK